MIISFALWLDFHQLFGILQDWGRDASNPLSSTFLGLSTKEVLTFGRRGQAKLKNNTDRERAMSIKQISFSTVDSFLAPHVISSPQEGFKGLLNSEMTLAREKGSKILAKLYFMDEILGDLHKK